MTARVAAAEAAPAAAGGGVGVREGLASEQGIGTVMLIPDEQQQGRHEEKNWHQKD
jgi:hypothetical protein